MRLLTDIEQQRLSLLTSKSVEVVLIEPTQTGLKKSILDATASVRNHLFDKEIHDYSSQKKGPDHKTLLKSTLITKEFLIDTWASLYRPMTKNGDPRIWFRGLGSFCNPNDILAIFIHDNHIFVLNLTSLDIENILNVIQTGPLWDILQDISTQYSYVSQELLKKLQEIGSKGPIRSITDRQHDTSIGRTIEDQLGIQMNSNQFPDYKGIEIKSFRSQPSGRENRKTLFAQVPNWNISKFKSSKEILTHFGYDRDNEFKLYCTVSTQVKNSQGLQLKIDKEYEKLIETSDKESINDFATWLMSDLRKKLSEKHNETFWISAKSSLINNIEHFELLKALHTKKPILSQFDILVEQGIITVDHLIKRNSKGRVSEKGPLFKIKHSHLEMLFPPSQEYSL